jgi:hypothetical protein
VNFGAKASPSFVDIDNDGDFDVFVGGTNSIRFYRNEGTAFVPVFVEKTGSDNPLSEVIYGASRSFSPTFVDIDNDEDYDVFIGWVDFNIVDSQGILYYKNTGAKQVAVFEDQEEDNPFQSFNELYPTPIFVDADGDGDQDVFIGKGDGIVDYYKNTSESLSLDRGDGVILGFSMYPNPTSDIVNFSGVKEDIQIRIYNLHGQKIIEKIVSPNQNSVDISLLKTGIYLMTTKIGDIKISKRLVVSK